MCTFTLGRGRGEVVREVAGSLKVFLEGSGHRVGRVLWGSISYAVKAPDIPPIKTEDLERTTLGPTQVGGSEAENNMCMCVL